MTYKREPVTGYAVLQF